MDERYEVTLAYLEVTAPGMLEIRFKPGAHVNAQAMGELQGTRHGIFSGAPHVVLSLIPDDVTVDLAMVNVDVHHATRPDDGLRAAALVAPGGLAEIFMRMYYVYYPPHFKLLVAAGEQEARAWIAEQHAQLSGRGSRRRAR